MILYNAGLENHPDGTQGLNAVINGNWDVLDNMFSPSLGLTASQATNQVTASATVFTSDDVGALIRFADGTTRTISGYTSGTLVTVSVSGTVASQSFKLYRTDQTGADALMRGLTKRVRMLAADDGLVFYWDNTAKRLQTLAEVAHADQGAVTMGNTNGEIAALTFSASPTQAECEALRDKCEELADDVRAILVLLHAIRTALITANIIKGSA